MPQPSPGFRAERARYAGLVRHRANDDPELASARQSMQEQILINAIDKALSEAPPLTPEMRSRIVGLLADHASAGATTNRRLR
jgi:hypothetical protein